MNYDLLFLKKLKYMLGYNSIFKEKKTPKS